MKRRLVCLMIVPLLASCGMNDDYTNDYRRPPLPTARVDVPNQTPGYADRAAPVIENTHQHDESSVTVRASARPAPREDNEANVMRQYDDYHAHGHD